MSTERKYKNGNHINHYGWKSKLRHQMSPVERQEYDFEMEEWAREHQEKIEKGSIPEGLITDEGKKFWKSMCWALKFEWNYSDARYQIVESCISEENPQKDEPITADDYLMERLREIGLVK